MRKRFTELTSEPLWGQRLPVSGRAMSVGDTEGGTVLPSHGAARRLPLRHPWCPWVCEPARGRRGPGLGRHPLPWLLRAWPAGPQSPERGAGEALSLDGSLGSKPPSPRMSHRGDTMMRLEREKQSLGLKGRRFLKKQPSTKVSFRRRPWGPRRRGPVLPARQGHPTHPQSRASTSLPAPLHCSPRAWRE